MPATKASIEDAQTEITTIIGNLGQAKENDPDDNDKLAIDSQIRDLTGKWLELDAIRASTDSSSDINNAVGELSSIDDDINAAKANVSKIAEVIHLAAQAIGVVEKLLALIAAA